MNLDLIPDIGLLQELLSFDMKRNCDRVMALVGCIIGLEEIHNIKKRTDTAQTSVLTQEFLKFIVNNKRIFSNAEFSQTKTVLSRQD